MSQQSKRKSGRRKRSHANLTGFNDLVAAYKTAFPGMSHKGIIAQVDDWLLTNMTELHMKNVDAMFFISRF